MGTQDSLDALFRPTSVAVIGAGRTRGTIGNTILWNLIAGGFTGKVFPVNPKAEAVHSIKCWPDVRAVPDPVDLAVVTVPAAHVLEVVRAAAEKGVKGLCVISAGFREVGKAGAARERDLLELCRRHGIRLVGPNCMGLLNTDPATSMNATFAHVVPRPGHVAFLSQSGAMGVSVLDHAEDLGLGIRMFASMGNKADVSGNDLLEYWEQDPETKIVLLYLESFGNPRKFIPLARRMTRTKPVICVKAGRTEQAARAAASHTGALAGADVAAVALLEQTGVLRVDSVREMFDVAQTLSSQPFPAGRRVAILTNAGGPAILATDFLVYRGLEMATLSPATKAWLRKVLVAEASVENPVDMVAGAGAKEYADALPLLLADPGVDMVITIFVPPVSADPIGVAQAIFHAERDAKKPVLGCFMARDAVIDEIKRLKEEWFPVFLYPEDAVRAAWNLVRAKELRNDHLGEPKRFEVDRAGATRILAAASKRGGGWLPAADAFAVLKAYGIPHPPHAAARDAEEAVAAAARLGGPVALKLDGEAFLHKSDVGGVVLGLEGQAEVRAAARRLEEAAARGAPGAPYRIFVQRMARPGTELVVGVRTDPVFGPLLLVGLGGIYVEVLKDTRSALVPLTPVLAQRLIHRLKAFPILEGSRGKPGADLAAVEEVLLRLSQLIEEQPLLVECEMNPVMARPDGAEAVDVRLRV